MDDGHKWTDEFVTLAAKQSCEIRFTSTDEVKPFQLLPVNWNNNKINKLKELEYL